MEVVQIIEELSILRFFPGNASGRLALARLAVSMATDVKQIKRLVARMTSGIYNEWPGPAEMRACFCSMYRPKDGIEASSIVYPDGLPSESLRALPAPETPLPAGLLYSADTELDHTMRELAEIQRARQAALDAATAEAEKKNRLWTAPKPTQDEIDALAREQNARRIYPTAGD